MIFQVLHMSQISANRHKTQINPVVMSFENGYCTCNANSGMMNVMFRVVGSKEFFMFRQSKMDEKFVYGLGKKWQIRT